MRIFYAITFEEETKIKLSHYRDQLSNHALKGRFTDTSNLHLTLEFIGEIKQADLHMYEEVIDYLEVIPLNLTVNHIGQFPKKNRSILWLGLKDNKELSRLQKNLKRLLETFDLQTEKRKFHPHITIGRQVLLDIQTNDFMIPPLDLKVSSVALMHSHKIKDRLVYEPIFEKFF